MLAQVHQQELGAQIRLPPLNPKATASLKHLAAGMGSLFAGPVDNASLLLQWSPSTSGSTLPMGGSAYRNEDHDSAAAAALGPGQLGSAGSKCRVSCVLFGAVPGRLWAGCADGKVFCWEAAGDGSVARLLHSWEAHSGKVKGLALSPSGRLFTGAGACVCVCVCGIRARRHGEPPVVVSCVFLLHTYVVFVPLFFAAKQALTKEPLAPEPFANP